MPGNGAVRIGSGSGDHGVAVGTSPSPVSKGERVVRMSGRNSSSPHTGTPRLGGSGPGSRCARLPPGNAGRHVVQLLLRPRTEAGRTIAEQNPFPGILLFQEIVKRNRPQRDRIAKERLLAELAHRLGERRRPSVSAASTIRSKRFFSGPCGRRAHSGFWTLRVFGVTYKIPTRPTLVTAFLKIGSSHHFQPSDRGRSTDEASLERKS